MYMALWFLSPIKKKVYFSPFWSGLLGIASNLTLNFKTKEWHSVLQDDIDILQTDSQSHLSDGTTELPA